jgi:hypothetical protein
MTKGKINMLCKAAKKVSAKANKNIILLATVANGTVSNKKPNEKRGRPRMFPVSKYIYPQSSLSCILSNVSLRYKVPRLQLMMPKFKIAQMVTTTVSTGSLINKVPKLQALTSEIKILQIATTNNVTPQFATSGSLINMIPRL